MLTSLCRTINGIVGFFVDLFRRYLQRGNLNRMLDDIDQTNLEMQDLGEYENCAIEAFVGKEKNIAVSGDNILLRNRVNCAAAWQSYQNYRPTIILHNNNCQLESLMMNAFGANILNLNNRTYDPFVGLQVYDIAQLVTSSSRQFCPIESVGNAYIRGLVSYLQAKGSPVCVDTCYHCLREENIEVGIFDLISRGQISNSEGQRIMSELAQGQIEMENIKTYFQKLREEGCTIIADSYSANSASSIKRVLTSGNATPVMINIGSTANTLLLDVIFQEIRDAIIARGGCSVIIDGIPVDSTRALGELLRSCNGTNSNFVLSASDLYAAVQNPETMIDPLITSIDTLFILKHSDVGTCRRWAEKLGKYRKIEVNRTVTSTENYQQYNTSQAGATIGEVYGMPVVEAYRVEVEDLRLQEIDHVYIKSRSMDEIISVYIANGDVRNCNETPIRINRRVMHRHNIRWRIFILLLIFCAPTAFIYSFFTTGRRGKIISVICFLLLVLLLVRNY